MNSLGTWFPGYWWEHRSPDQVRLKGAPVRNQLNVFPPRRQINVNFIFEFRNRTSKHVNMDQNTIVLRWQNFGHGKSSSMSNCYRAERRNQVQEIVSGALHYLRAWHAECRGSIAPPVDSSRLLTLTAADMPSIPVAWPPIGSSVWRLMSISVGEYA